MDKKQLLDKLNRWFHDRDFVEEHVIKRADFFLDYIQERIKEWIVVNKKSREDINLTYRSFLKDYNWNGISRIVKMNLYSVSIEGILEFILRNCSKDEEYFIPIIEGHAGQLYRLFLKDHVQILLTDSQIESYYEDGTMDKYYPELRTKYMFLSRLQEDCNHYLGYGNRNAKISLWAEDEKKQIAEMKKTWNEIPDDKKPKWLTWEEILEYEKKMVTDLL